MGSVPRTSAFSEWNGAEVRKYSVWGFCPWKLNDEIGVINSGVKAQVREELENPHFISGLLLHILL
jgi:hypothetical protein